jgi:hypothetical protein
MKLQHSFSSFALAVCLLPSVSPAETIKAGLWEVIGYPKAVQVSVEKSKHKLLAVSAKDQASVRFATERAGTIDFENEANVANLADNTLVMDVCIRADNTWSEVNYGSQVGQWGIIGSNISLSGNDSIVGSSGVLATIDPNGTMSGDWQQWLITAPLTQQDVYSSMWTFKNSSC